MIAITHQFASGDQPRYIAGVIPRRVLLIAVAALCLASLTACPGKRTRNVGGNLAIPTNGNPEAKRRFESLQQGFHRDATHHDATEFEAIVQEFPDDPIAPYALLYAGMSSVRAGEYEKALENLKQLDEDVDADARVRARGRVYQGIALNYLGRHQEALSVLRSAERGVNNDDPAEKAEWLAAMAEANSQVGRAADAIEYYDAWYDVGRESEKAYAIARIKALVGSLSDDAVAKAYDSFEDKSRPAAALLGQRYASHLAAGGDTARAAQVRKQIESALEALGLSDKVVGGAAGDPSRVGAVLPLSGKRARIGDLYMRGLSLAASVFGKGGGGISSSGRPKSFGLVVRDSASVAASAEAGMGSLADDGVIAAVGPVDVDAVDRAGTRAARAGMPMVSLSSRPGEQSTSSPYVFHVVHSAEDRARALARYAIDKGIKDFGILRPDNNYGKVVGKAFADEVVRLGGSVIVNHSYDATTTSFKKDIRKIKKPWQALFVPDKASRLELVAPALAVANLESRPVDQRKKRGRRKFLLLSTAEFLEPGYITSSGRYSWGAVFAPGFYPDRTDKTIGEFVDEYFASFGRLPTSLDAYAYDAALTIRAAVENGAETRAELAEALARESVVGLTGRIRFDSSRKRADDGVLYTVEKDDDNYEIKAMR